MPIERGMKLGHYEIVEPIGAGGMGEVYRARDTRLDRTVAIKVLPEHPICERRATSALRARSARGLEPKPPEPLLFA